MGNPQHNLFYVEPGKIAGNALIIKGEGFHHIKHVLRKDQGHEITVTDGAGFGYRCRIVSVTKKELRAEIVEKHPAEPRPGPALDIAFVPLKGTRNDLIIEKGTELGVSAFIPFISRHAVNRDISASKLDRFETLAVAAMLQSQRFFLPRVRGMSDTTALTSIFSEYDLILTADDKGLSDIPGSANSILFVTGPEGGFDLDEIALMRNAGARLVSLGSHRLRAETAVLAGIVKILTAYKRL